MKNWKKAISLLTALTTVAASTSAFAAISATGSFNETGFVADYTNVPANAEVVVTVDAEDSQAEAGKQMSFLILNDGTDEADIQAEDILYIDQQEAVEGEDTVFDGKISLARLGDDLSEIPAGEYPIKVGYTKDGEFAIAEALMVVEDVTTTYTIAFYDKAGTNVLQSGQVAQNGTVTPPTAPQNVTEGDKKYHFVGWAVKDDQTQTLVDPIPNAVADVNYIAVYEEDDKYTATFLNDDGSTFGTASAYAGDKLTLPTGTAVTKLAANAGKKMDFVGWIKDGEQSPTNFGTFEMPAEAVTFTANFVEHDKYDATFKAHFIVEGDQDVVIPTYVGDPIEYQGATPTKEHFTFKGWSLENDNTPDANLGTMGDADVTVYACWQEDAKYTVTFYNADNTTFIAFTDVYAGTAITGVGTPVKDGYEFKGWATEADAEEADIVEVPATVTGNASYYPVFTEVQSQGKKVTVIWGNLDTDPKVDIADVSALLSFTTKRKADTGAELLIGQDLGTDGAWGNLDSDPKIDIADVSALLSFTTKRKADAGGSYLIGAEVTLTIPE